MDYSVETNKIEFSCFSVISDNSPYWKAKESFIQLYLLTNRDISFIYRVTKIIDPPYIYNLRYLFLFLRRVIKICWSYWLHSMYSRIISSTVFLFSLLFFEHKRLARLKNDCTIIIDPFRKTRVLLSFYNVLSSNFIRRRNTKFFFKFPLYF